jgi:hypothetical protein
MNLKIKKYYHEYSGQLLSMQMYNSDSGKFIGTQMGWYENGNIRYQYFIFEGHDIIGMCLFWFENGLRELITSGNGKDIHGPRFYFNYDK